MRRGRHVLHARDALRVRVGLRRPDRRANLVVGGVRNHSFDQFLRGIFEMPVGLPAASRTITPPGTSFVFLSMPAWLQRERIRKPHVAVQPADEYGILRRHGVDQFVRGRVSGRQFS